MTDIKISQLSNVASVNFTDEFAISRANGSEWDSYSLTYHDLVHSIVGQSVVTVDIDGNITTIEAGISEAQEKTPSATQPAVILVKPGVYTENPLTLPDYVSLIATGDNNTTYVDAITTTSPILTLGNYSSVTGFTFRNANGSGGAAVKGIGSNGIMTGCSSLNCETGFWEGGGNSIRAINCAVIKTPGQVGTYAYRSDASGVFTIEQCIVNGATTISLVDYGFYCSGVGSRMFMPTFFAFYCVNGVYVNNGGNIDSDSGYIQNCTNGMRIGSGGSDSLITSLGTSIESCTTYDVFIESTTGQIDFTGKMDYNKRSIVSGSDIASIGVDRANDMIKSTGKLSIEGSTDIGIPGAFTDALGIGLDVGEGGSYNVDSLGNSIVEFWQYDDSAASGSKFTRYADNAGTQLGDEDDAIVVGSKYPFSAIRLDVNTASNVGSNSYVAEHWNGLTWVSDGICAYKKSDMTSRGTVIFQNVETQYVEFGKGINDDWVSDENILDEVPNWDYGANMYPVRFRNNGGALTTPMVFDSGKVRGDDFDITDSQIIVIWGRYRQQETLVIPVDLMSSDSNNPPANVTINISTNVSSDVLGNFQDGAVSALNYRQIIPTWADPSTEMRLTVMMYPLNGNVGNVNIVARIVPLGAGSIIDGSATENNHSLIGTTPGISNSLFGAVTDIDIELYSPGSGFVLSLERDATAGNPLDTYVGNIVVFGAKMTWTRKRLG